MKDKIKSLVYDLKSKKGLDSYDEQATKLEIILQILFHLGWDIFDRNEVYPEYSLESQNVDYSLRINNKNKVFIEAKRIREELDKHQKQLLEYSFKAGVSLAILTNGLSWWFYLPLMKDAEWEERKFYTIDLIEQEPERIADKFIDLLSKDNILSNKAIENAEATHKSQQKKKIIKEALPKAWNKIIYELDVSLVNLLMDTTEILCGHSVGTSLAKQFITSNKDNLTLTEKPVTRIPTSNKNIPTPAKKLPISNRKPPKDQASASRADHILSFLQLQCPGVKAENIGLLIEIDGENSHTFNVDWENIKNRVMVFGISGKRRMPANALKEVFGNKFTKYGNIARKVGKFVDTSNPSKAEIAHYSAVEKHVGELSKQGLIDLPSKREILVNTKMGTYFDSMDSHKQEVIEKNIIQRRELWEVFVKNKRMTSDDFKKHSQFKKKGVAGFIQFLTHNNIANKFGGIFKINDNVIPQIQELLKNYK